MSALVVRQRTEIMIGQLSDLKPRLVGKVFAVCDPFLLETPIMAALNDLLSGSESQIYSEVKPDPDIDQVAAGVGAMANFEPQTVMAVGGGSAIDAAKAMSYFYRKVLTGPRPTCIVVPTTSGTGSEVTSFAVITDSATHAKYPLITDELLPDIALLDKNLVKTVPPKVTADSGMDVLTHALEAYVSTNANAFSDAYAEQVVELAFGHLAQAYKVGQDDAAREGMHVASTMAGLAFNMAGLGLVHGISHAAGARFHIPHGRLNAILLPRIVQFNAADGKSAQRYLKLARIAGASTESATVGVRALVQAIRQLRSTMNMPATFSQYGVPKAELVQAQEAIAAAALADPATATNPRPATTEDIIEILHNLA